MSLLQILGVILLTAALVAVTTCVGVMLRRRRTLTRMRFEASGLLGDFASDSARAEGEFEAALAGLRAADGPGLADWLGRLIRTGRQHERRLDAVHARLERFAAAERPLASTAGEVARQRDRVQALCRTVETADVTQPRIAAATVVAAVTDVLIHEQALRTEAIDARSRLEGRAARLADAERDRFTDPLTRLPNRRAFHERLAVAGRPEGGAFGIVVLVVEGHADVTARLGHAAGDAMVAVAARVIGESAGRDGFVARIGADEFAILLPNADPQAAGTAAARCRRAAEFAAVRLPTETIPVALRTVVGARAAGSVPSDVLADALMAVASTRTPNENRSEEFDASFSNRGQGNDRRTERQELLAVGEG